MTDSEQAAERQPGDDGESLPPGLDDDPWEAFVPDDDQLDPLPEPGDFWVEREM